MSYDRLPTAEMQQSFAQLGVFNQFFPLEAAAAIWHVSALVARKRLDQLVSLALVIRERGNYRLKSLVRDYTRQMLESAWPNLVQITYRRHLAFYIRHKLYHPQVVHDADDIENAANLAPSLDQAWADIMAGVKWATVHASDLATFAAVLAYTERPMLLEEIGPGLGDALVDYAAQITDAATQAVLLELVGDLYLPQQNFAAALTYFQQASVLWISEGQGLASSRLKLREASVYLLYQDHEKAAEAARQAQADLAQSLHLVQAEMAAAQRLFCWFNMIYLVLVRWEPLSQADVARLADLAEQTGNDLLKATGCHIYRLWCTP